MKTIKKSDCEKLSRLTFEDFNNITQKQADSMLKNVLPTKSRFKSRAVGSDGWWHVKKYIELEGDENEETIYMCVIRSWDKHRQKWVYKCMGCLDILYCIHLDNHYM